MIHLSRKHSSNISASDTLGESFVISPELFEDLPDSIFKLRAIEGALFDLLISFHYRLDQLKLDMEKAFQCRETKRGSALWTQRVELFQKKRRYEEYLETIQEKIKNMKKD